MRRRDGTYEVERFPALLRVWEDEYVGVMCGGRGEGGLRRDGTYEVEGSLALLWGLGG